MDGREAPTKQRLASRSGVSVRQLRAGGRAMTATRNDGDYVNPTGRGYLGVHRVGEGSILIDVTPLDVDAATELGIECTDDTVIVRPDDGSFEPTTTATPTPKTGKLWYPIGTPVQRDLGVEPGDDVRLYDHPDGIEVVPADADPYVGGDR